MRHAHRKQPLVVVHTPAGGGHRAAANAVAEAARALSLEAVVIDALELSPRWFRDTYVAAHLGSTSLVPSLYGGAYFASNQRVEQSEVLRRELDRHMGAKLLERVQQLDPLAVVATHFYPLTVFGDARRRGTLGAPLIGVVTDYAAHAVWAEPAADALCGPGGRALSDLRRHGAQPERLFATGIPVRPAFSAVDPPRCPAPGEPLQVLVTSGGFGVGPLLDTLRSFTRVPDVQLTVVCGDNPALVARARRLVARRAIDAEVVGYERDMPGRIARAHLVVGKPGGLTTTECLVAGRPMICVGAVPGQETLNQDWLVQAGVATKASPRRVGKEITRIRETGAWEQMVARTQGLVLPDSARRIVGLALALRDGALRSAA